MSQFHNWAFFKSLEELESIKNFVHLIMDQFFLLITGTRETGLTKSDLGSTALIQFRCKVEKMVNLQIY